MLDWTLYTIDHQRELAQLLDSDEWREVTRSGLVDKVKAECIEPAVRRDFTRTAVDQLVAFNERRVRALIAEGHEDEDLLLAELGRWPDTLKPRLSFVGLNLTADCNLDPKCSYCNQPWVDGTVDLRGWKRTIAEVTAGADGEGPYVYLTGGEPLVLGEEVWGDDGLVRYATEKGAVVNINTNAAMLTAETALRLIRAGLARLHVSLDTADSTVQEQLRGGQRFGGIMRGIYNVQLARDLVGVSYPEIHTNCVLTNKNLKLFPGLFAWILEKRKQTSDKKAPLFNDLFPHVIPVGGESNRGLRPSESEFRAFYEDVWTEVCDIWEGYQEKLGIPPEGRGTLVGYFSNPFLRVDHRGGLDAYARASADGRYGALALARRCYVAPTQATFTPDGQQYRCGSHAVRRILPLGNVAEAGVFESIRAGIKGLEDLPRVENCHGCALATLYINQSVESKLKDKIRDLKAVERSPSG